MFGQITIRVADRGAVVDDGTPGRRTYGAGDHGFFAPDRAGDDVEPVHHRPAEGEHR